MNHDRDEQIAVPVTLAVMAAVVIADVSLAAISSVAGLYLFPVLVSMWVPRRRFILLIAWGCTLLSVLGFFVVYRGDDLLLAALGRLIAVGAIWITAHLGLKRAEIQTELMQSRELMATTLRSIADGVITSDRIGRVTFLNPTAERFTGWSFESAVGRPLSDVVQLTEQVGDSMPLPDEVRACSLRRKDGSQLVIDHSVSTVSNDRGQAQGKVMVLRDVTERQQYQQEIRNLAFVDNLTGLLNRVAFNERLGLELAHARRDGTLLALLFIDLDGLKRVNDRYGHGAGDALLRGVAERLVRCVREADTVARLAGDEFTVVAPKVRGPQDAARVAKRILVMLKDPIPYEGHELPGTPSIGIALFPQDGVDASHLLSRADAAMYRAKQAGGNRWCFWSKAVGESKHNTTAAKPS